MKISALIHTKNSEKTVVQALNSVRWADEIVVVDMNSSDTTVNICKHYTDNIYYFDDVGYVEPARNFGISKVTGDWVLILDADEEIPASLIDKLRKLTESEMDVWELPRKNILFGHWIQHAGWWPDYNVRFFRKGHVDWPREIHAQPKTEGKRERLPAKEEYAIIHHNYPTVSEFITRMDKYTSITASEKRKFEHSPLVAFWHEFQSRFLAKEGYKDGNPGLYVSLLQSMYEAVVRIKQWEADKVPVKSVDVGNELSEILSQISYWRADYMLKHTKGIRRVYWRFRRKLSR
jgi:glycosyltransferase involved in cell wall biosynthesis